MPSVTMTLAKMEEAARAKWAADEAAAGRTGANRIPFDASPYDPYGGPGSLSKLKVTDAKARNDYLSSSGRNGLSINQSITSQNGQYQLILQPDGNLVLYKTAGHIPIWESETQGKGVTKAVLQSDGNFVLLAGAVPVWSTQSSSGGASQVSLQIQDDGNLVLWDVLKNKAIWASNTVGGRDARHDDSFLGNVGKAVGSITNSAIWKVIAVGVNIVPGIGTAVSAGMVGATVVGKLAMGKSDVFTAAAAGMNLAEQAGFTAGLGVISENPAIKDLKEIRGTLANYGIDVQVGFDAALALTKGMTGQNGAPPPSDMTSPEAIAAFYTAQGLRGTPPEVIQRVAPLLTKTPAAKAGFSVGVVASSDDTKFANWLWRRLKAELRYIGVKI